MSNPFSELPRVQVRVEMDDRDRAIRAVNGAQERQHDMWSPPSVITCGWCFPSFKIDMSGAPVSESFGGAENGVRCSKSQWPSSICWIAYALSYGVTGMVPQSMSLSLDKNGFTSNGTLYPPYNVRHHDPEHMPAGPKRAPGLYEVPVSCEEQHDKSSARCMGR